MLSTSFLRVDPVFSTNTNVLLDSLLKSMTCYFLNFISHLYQKKMLCMYIVLLYILNIYKVHCYITLEITLIWF